MKIRALSLATYLVATGASDAQVHAGSSKCPAMKAFPSLPSAPFQYNGDSMPERCYEGDGEEHIFLIGDYGGITCNEWKSLGRDPNIGNCGYRRRKAPAAPFVKAPFNFKPDIGRVAQAADYHPQSLVAEQMRKRAPSSKPRYIINGGDNFYFGGIDLNCGEPMNTIHPRTAAQFDLVFEKMYSGPGLDDVPWFGTLGNHDWGGFHFHKAWDQQIAYTWSKSTHKVNTSTGRWILPAMYYHQKVNYPTKDFSIDFFFLDNNVGDARDPTDPSMSNICSGTLNQPGVSCAKVGGPRDANDCTGWFRKKWDEQFAWFQKKIMASTATWQILVAHFPPDRFGKYGGGPDWKNMWKNWGLDLFIGSHTHEQKLAANSDKYGGLNYVVIGGGGGITSEWNPGFPGAGQHQYGFMDLTVSKTQIKIESINEVGKVAETATITPRENGNSPKAKAAVAECAKECTTGTVKDDCKSRVDWTMRHKHMSVSKAIAAVNADCASQCSCTEDWFSSSLLQEEEEEVKKTPAERKQEILYKKKFLMEELLSLDYAFNVVEDWKAAQNA